MAIRKVTRALTPSYRRLIEAAPFCAIATAGPEGLDCSPRGDLAGFVRIENDSTLLLPERRGNNRVDTLRNLVHDPRSALLFLIPGIAETLRVNGRGVLSRNVDLCQSFAVSGKPPQVVIVFHIEAVYFQCAKAIVRSHLWDASRFLKPGDVPTGGAMLTDATCGEEGGPEWDRALTARIQSTLY